MTDLEKLGVPTVAITAADFVRDAHLTAESLGLPSLPVAVCAEPFTSHSSESIVAMTDSVLDDVISALTASDEGDDESTPASEIVLLEDTWLKFEGADLLEALDAMNGRFLEYGWSDGFPLCPATRDRMEHMLTGTSRPRDEVIGILEPGSGIATVEAIAANAVMAGCLPEHLPVVIAAIECFADPIYKFKGKAMSTGPQGPLLLVNGPIRQKIGLNSGRCSLGGGSTSFVNAVIGRAVRLCTMNIAHCYPEVSDMDTIGSPIKFGVCAAENEEANPWAPYHVDAGFARDVSTVTAEYVYGICELHDRATDIHPDSLIEIFASAAQNLQNVTGKWLLGHRSDPRVGADEKEHDFLLICPEHAEVFAKSGWSKQDVKRAMFAKARMSFRSLMLSRTESTTGYAPMTNGHPELAWLWDSPETLLPVLEGPDCFDIAVVGGPVGRGAFFWGCGEPMTKVIRD